MGKKDCKCEEAPAGAPLWMATFSDMVTLLLTFFVLLLSMANFDDSAKVDTVLESVQTALASNGLSRASLGASRMPEQMPTEPVVRVETISPTEARVRSAMEQHVSPDLVIITKTDDEVRIRLDDQVLFKPGSTTLHPAAFALLTDLATTLDGVDVDIQVEGHTDATGDESENWRISSERSLAVVSALRERGGIDGERLQAEAHGQFQPAEAFGAAPGWNRRIELVLRSNDVDGEEAIRRLEAP